MQKRGSQARGEEEGRELLFNGCRVSVWDNGKVLEIDHGAESPNVLSIMNVKKSSGGPGLRPRPL